MEKLRIDPADILRLIPDGDSTCYAYRPAGAIVLLNYSTYINSLLTSQFESLYTCIEIQCVCSFIKEACRKALIPYTEDFYSINDVKLPGHRPGPFDKAHGPEYVERASR